jgi:outer membrane protein
LSAEQTLKFTNADVKATARQLEQAKQRFEVGLIAITDVNEAQARYDGGRADAIVAANNVDDQKEALLEITGVPPGPLADLKPTVPLKPPAPASLDEWTETALTNNPAIISAKYNVDIAKKEIAFQDAADSPALDLVGSYALSRSDADAGVDSNNGIVGVQLSIPLYTGGGVQAATRQARHQYAAAQDVLEETRRSVQAQVRNGYRGVLSTISQVRALEATQVSAQSALEATEAGFEVGTRTLVDVLNSQRELFRAKRDLAVSRYNYVLNMLSLLQAAGTLSTANIEAANAWLGEPPDTTGSK